MLCCHGNYLTLVQAKLLRSHKEGTGQPCWLIKPIQGPHGNSFSSPLAFPSTDTVCVNDQAPGLLDQRHSKVKKAQPTSQLQGIRLAPKAQYSRDKNSCAVLQKRQRLPLQDERQGWVTAGISVDQQGAVALCPWPSVVRRIAGPEDQRVLYVLSYISEDFGKNLVFKH